MSRFAALLIVFVLISQVPVPAIAQRRGGATRASSASARSPAMTAPTRPSGGFNFQNDMNRSRSPGGRAPVYNSNNAARPGNGNLNRNNANLNTNNRTNVNRNNTNANRNNTNVNRNNTNANRNNTNVNRNNTNVNRSGNTVNNVNVNRTTNVTRSTNPAYAGRTVVVNPVYPAGPAWGWNHGAAWYPAPAYWGGGFWGAMAIGVTSAAVFGSIVNSTSHTTYTSYQVQPSSPGSTLLNNYGLQQVQCGPSGLVVIYGPNNGVICANPNNEVAAGEYDVDTQHLTLVNRTG